MHFHSRDGMSLFLLIGLRLTKLFQGSFQRWNVLVDTRAFNLADQPAFAVKEEGHRDGGRREHFFHAFGCDQVQILGAAVLQDLSGELDLALVVRVCADADDPAAFRFKFLCKFGKIRQFPLAGGTPGCLEVDHRDPASGKEFRAADRVAVQVGCLKGNRVAGIQDSRFISRGSAGQCAVRPCPASASKARTSVRHNAIALLIFFMIVFSCCLYLLILSVARML